MKQKYNKCAGIDIGSTSIFIALEGKDGFSKYGTTTADFQQASEMLKGQAIEHVAMEATGVYWMGLFDILETHGFKVTLVKAGDAKNLPGRDKTDGEDCQWICKLFSHGLLRPSVILEDKIRQVRQYLRIRQDHISLAAQHKQHIQKSFIMMNVRLPESISDITGSSGRKMIEAILEGERDAEQLLSLCHSSIRNKKREQVLKALTGIYKEEYLFGLQQAYECWKFYQYKIQVCDQKIDEWLNVVIPSPINCEDKKLKRSAGVNKLNIENIEQKLLSLNGGRDVTKLPGIGCNNAMQLIGELGLDLTKWPTHKQFVNYLGLCGQKNYSGKIKRQKKRRMPAAGQIFREAAQTLMLSTKTGLGAFARKLKARKGPFIAIKATARKLAIQYYNVLTKGFEFVEKGINDYQEKVKRTELLRLAKLAKKHGLVLATAQLHQ